MYIRPFVVILTFMYSLCAPIHASSFYTKTVSILEISYFVRPLGREYVFPRIIPSAHMMMFSVW